MMKKFKKEIFAIVSGIVFAYLWQLFMIILCYISDPNGNFITGTMFIPMSSIQLAITPMVAWGLMGLMKVTWFEKWLYLTVRILTFTMPFVLISVVTIIVAPSLWRESIYWIINAGISIIIGFTVSKSLFRSKYSDMEQNLPKENKKC